MFNFYFPFLFSMIRVVQPHRLRFGSVDLHSSQVLGRIRLLDSLASLT